MSYSRSCYSGISSTLGRCQLHLQGASCHLSPQYFINNKIHRAFGSEGCEIWSQPLALVHVILVLGGPCFKLLGSPTCSCNATHLRPRLSHDSSIDSLILHTPAPPAVFQFCCLHTYSRPKPQKKTLPTSPFLSMSLSGPIISTLRTLYPIAKGTIVASTVISVLLSGLLYFKQS